MLRIVLLSAITALIAATAVFISESPSHIVLPKFWIYTETVRTYNYPPRDDSYNPGYNSLGLPAPSSPPREHIWVAYSCTYLPPTMQMQTWQYIEMKYAGGKPADLKSSAVEKPSAEELEKCSTVEDFKNILGAKYISSGKTRPFQR